MYDKNNIGSNNIGPMISKSTRARLRKAHNYDPRDVRNLARLLGTGVNHVYGMLQEERRQAQHILEEIEGTTYSKRRGGDIASATLGTALQRLQRRQTDAAEGPGERETQLSTEHLGRVRGQLDPRRRAKPQQLLLALLLYVQQHLTVHRQLRGAH